MNLFFSGIDGKLDNKRSEKIYDEELDNEVSVILDICDILHRTDKVTFKVSGFGFDNWLVDCGFDLPCVLEVLPCIISKISKNNYNFELDFFEQGTERTVFFKDNGDHVLLDCISRTDWQPNPKRIIMQKEDIKSIFENFRDDFINCSEKICKDLLHNEFLAEWLNAIKIGIN
ncbi:MAG: hypothetical protein ACK5IJ_05200 [Mangrovibacterium sp.]